MRHYYIKSYSISLEKTSTWMLKQIKQLQNSTQDISFMHLSVMAVVNSTASPVIKILFFVTNFVTFLCLSRMLYFYIIASNVNVTLWSSLNLKWTPYLWRSLRLHFICRIIASEINLGYWHVNWASDFLNSYGWNKPRSRGVSDV